MRRALALAMVIGSVGCGSGTADDADAGAEGPALLTGARILLTAEIQRPEDPGPRIVVSDLARDGDRVVLLVRSSPLPNPTVGVGVRTLVLVSDDRGATFREIELPTSTARTATRVAIGEGRIAVVFDGEGAAIELAELEDGTLGTVRAIGTTPLAVDGPFVTTVTALSATSIGTSRYDVRTGTTTEGSAALRARTCAQWLFERDADGAWRRWCYATAERCLDTIDPESTGVGASELCVPATEWPIPQRLEQAQRRTSAGLWLVSTEGGHALVRSSRTGSPAPAAIDLGPGYVTGAAGDLWVLEAAGGATGGPRWVELAADGGTRELAFARSPCVEPAACGVTVSVGQLVRLAPLGEGRWLAVYVIRSGEAESLVVREVGEDEVSPSPITEGGQPRHRAVREPIVVTGELELACARALACRRGRTMADCIASWIEISGASAEADAHYRRFVETPPGDCEAWKATWPEYFGTDAATCAEQCVGEIAFQCDDAAMSMATIDCTRLGTSCRIDPEGRATCGPETAAACDACDGDLAVVCGEPGETRVTDCAALGLSCYQDPEHGDPRCTTGVVSGCTFGSGVCDGSIALECASTGHVRARRDCTRIDLGCRGGECDPPSSTPVCDAGPASACDGTFLTYCLHGERRYVDCLAIGGTGCDDAPPLGGVPRAYCAM